MLLTSKWFILRIGSLHFLHALAVYYQGHVGFPALKLGIAMQVFHFAIRSPPAIRIQRNEIKSLTAVCEPKEPRLVKQDVLLHIESCLFDMTTFEYQAACDTYAPLIFPRTSECTGWL